MGRRPGLPATPERLHSILGLRVRPDRVERSAIDYVSATAQRTSSWRTMQALFERVDVLTEIDGAAYERAVAVPYRTGSGKAGVLAGPESGPRGKRLMPSTLPKGSPTMFRQYAPGNRFRYEVHGGRTIPRGRESRFMARLGHIALVRDLSTDPCSRPAERAARTSTRDGEVASSFRAARSYATRSVPHLAHTESHRW